MSGPGGNGKRLKEPLSVTHPHLATEWHPTKNGELTPDKVIAASKKKVWWRCPMGPDHEWQATLDSRMTQGTGCPYCRGLRASVTNSLASLFPEIADQWHPTKNEDLSPDMVVSGSGKVYWWKCPEGPGHEWQARISHRTRAGSGCPYCAGNKASVTNSLSSLFPEVAAEWHPTNNGDVTPDMVVAGSEEKYWWKCPKGPDHEWQVRVAKRTYGGQGCPCCRGLRVSVTNALASLFPEIAAQWHPTKNGDLTPDKVVAGSNWSSPRKVDTELRGA
jgi:hypothetical protein